MPVRRVRKSGQFSRFGGAMYGMRKLKPLPYGLMLQGAGRRRTVRRRRMGMGFLDTLKNIGSKALGIARSVPIVSTALSLGGPKLAPAAGIARSLGLGRKRRRVRRGGFMKGFMGAIPLSLNRGLGRKRRVGTKRRGMGILSNLLAMTGLGRKRVVRRRRMGGAVRRRRYIR